MKTIKLKSGIELPIMNLKGKDYLQVAHRLVWFREEHPDWGIETSFVVATDQSAMAKAIIRDEAGRLMATSHKEESAKDFPMGHREKAETGAIGRALALCGYGTQFEPDLDEGDRIVDSPIARQVTLPNGNISQGVYADQPGPNDGIQTNEYVCKYGAHLAGKPISECDPVSLREFIEEREAAYKKSSKPHGAWFIEFLKHAEPLIAIYENSPDFNGDARE
jgi:hypothetical protein